MKAKLGKIWTDSVAYVMLLVGAGLSILFNVVNTLARRGDLIDWVDWVIAIAAPGLVVGMVEMFVNARWNGQAWYMQVLRWAGTLAIGGVAMRVSWTHGHELLLSRGQTSDVAALFPLSIDLLAIMATGLILSGRVQSGVSSVQPDSAPAVSSVQPVLGDKDEVTQDISGVTWTPPADVPLFDGQAPDTLPSWLDGLADRVPTGPSALAAPLPQRPPVIPVRDGSRRLSEEDRAAIRALTAAGREHGMYGVGEIRELLAGWYGVSVKTVQRAELSQ